jgi:hypothetical protein
LTVPGQIDPTGIAAVLRVKAGKVSDVWRRAPNGEVRHQRLAAVKLPSKPWITDGEHPVTLEALGLSVGLAPVR